MRKPIFCILLFACSSFLLAGQQFGLSLGWGTSRSIYADLFMGNKSHRYHIGFTYQLRSTKGILVKEQLSNYGQTIEGKGTYFLVADLVYVHVIKGKLSLGGELSLGSKTDFTNYIDNRFTDGGYHMIDNKSFALGFGVNLGYIALESLEVFGGFNTIRKFTMGLRVLL